MDGEMAITKDHRIVVDIYGRPGLPLQVPNAISDQNKNVGSKKTGPPAR